MQFNIERFFVDIFEDEHINFGCLKGKMINVNGLYNENTTKRLTQLNNQGYEIYFAVNSGGYKDNDVNKVNAVFVDFDCGRDENRDYYPLDMVAKYKNEKLEIIHRFKLKPTYINDTRNGLHIFWLVNEGASVDEFIECQKRLIAFFNSDNKIKNPARLMRVPGFNWCKDPQNPYMCNILEHNEVRYDIHQIIDSLPPLDLEGQSSGDTRTSDKKKYLNYYSISGTHNPHSTDNLKLIRERKAETLRDMLNVKPITLNSHEEVYDYLKKQDLYQFLGVSGNKFHCIFHEDKNPSAGIIVNEETGHYIYNCFSSDCSFEKGTIIQITEKLTNLNKVDALRFLRQVYQITYAETEWQKQQKEILEENQRFLLSEDFKIFYPEIDKRINNYIPELHVFHDIAKEHVITENFTDSKNQPVFFVSLEHLANKCNKDIKTMVSRISLFTYLGLINKLSEEEIPPQLLKTAKHYAALKKQKKLVSFYSIPSYSHNTLEFCKKKAKEFEDKCFTMRGISREMFFRGLGEEEADRIYPQLKGKPFSSFSEEITLQMERIALELIKQKGWTTEREIIDSIQLYFRGQQRFKETHIKRIIPEMMDKYCLTRKKLNNKLKIRLNVDLQGYPYIIFREILK